MMKHSNDILTLSNQSNNNKHTHTKLRLHNTTISPPFRNFNFVAYIMSPIKTIINLQY